MTPRSYGVIATALGVALAGCTTAPRNGLSDVQRELASRVNATAAWPRTADDRARVDQNVATLLRAELTPETAARIALLNNRHLRATFEEIGLSEADLIAAGRVSNPSFSASVRWPNSRPRTPDVEFDLGLDVLNALLIPMRKNLAGEQLAAAERRVAHEAVDLATEAKAQVYEIQAREAFRDRLATILETNAAAAEFAQRQFDAGNINRLELLNQQAIAQEAQVELQRTNAQLARDREKLNRLLGLAEPDLDWKIAPTLPAPAPDEPAIDTLETSALARRLDLAAAQIDVSVARAALNLKQKTRLLPASLDLGIDTEHDPANVGSHSHVTGPNVALALPIFDQGQADLARLSAEARRAEANAEALAIDIRSDVRAARAAVVAARQTAEYFDHTLLPQRQEILRETLLQYNAMQRSSYDLLHAKEQLVEAERDRIEAWRDYWVARTQLERAVGGELTNHQS